MLKSNNKANCSFPHQTEFKHIYQGIKSNQIMLPILEK